MDLEPSDDCEGKEDPVGGVAADFAFAEAGDWLAMILPAGVLGGLEIVLLPFNCSMSFKASASFWAMSPTCAATFWGSAGLEINTKQDCGILLFACY